MTTINVQVVDQTLQVVNNPKIASGGQQENEMQFDFCSLWGGYSKTAVFYRNEETVYNVILVDDKCIVPDEVLTEEGTFYFGVYGVNGVVRRTTEVKQYEVVKGSFVAGDTPGEPTPDIYQQILAACAEAQTAAEEVRALYSETITVEDLESMVQVITDDAISGTTQDIIDINQGIAGINERLDELGFKEGSFTVDSSTGAAITTTINSIKKQGKYVIANLSIIDSSNGITSLNVPDEFKPKEATNIRVNYKINLTGTEMEYNHTFTLGADGTISGIGMACEVNIINAGWETN